jgi:hypothetical protein
VLEEPLISRPYRALCCEHGPACATERVVRVKTFLVRRLREVNEAVELTDERALRTSAQGTTVERNDAIARAGRLRRSEQCIYRSVREAQEPPRLHRRVYEHSRRKTDSREDWG